MSLARATALQLTGLNTDHARQLVTQFDGNNEPCSRCSQQLSYIPVDILHHQAAVITLTTALKGCSRAGLGSCCCDARDRAKEAAPLAATPPCRHELTSAALYTQGHNKSYQMLAPSVLDMGVYSPEAISSMPYIGRHCIHS